MEFKVLKNFIREAAEKWERIKDDLSRDEDVSRFLKKAYPVINFDHHQLGLNLAKNLYTETVCLDPQKPLRDEKELERFRQRMVSYLENEIEVVFFEVRFAYLNMELIQKVKAHKELKVLNSQDPASIRVVVDYLLSAEHKS